MIMRKALHAWILVATACTSDAADRASSFATSGTDGTTGATGGSAGTSTSSTATTGTSTTTGAGGTGIVVAPRDVDASVSNDAGDAGIGRDVEIITTLPPGFMAAQIGGFKLGAALGDGSDAGAAVDAGVGANENCGNILTGVVRDFKSRVFEMGHPDFEAPWSGANVTRGLVGMMLGADQKPVYASQCEEGHPMPAPICPFAVQTTTQANFDQWYRYTPDVNKPYLVDLWFAPQPNGLFTFQSTLFFPLDNAGWGNTPMTNPSHNFNFTTELHTKFFYKGGETFKFDGDDDVWVFINGHLAVDLGGLHPPETNTLVLDTAASGLGITAGNSYDLDLFHAERHTGESNFRIDTNLSFTNCGTLPPDVVVVVR
jgi:fibro-slime domain-containing protein